MLKYIYVYDVLNKSVEKHLAELNETEEKKMKQIKISEFLIINQHIEHIKDKLHQNYFTYFVKC